MTATAMMAGDVIAAVSGATATDAAPTAPLSATTHQTFSVFPKAGGGDYTLNIHGLGDGTNLPTTLTLTLYASSDGGTTFGIYGSAAAVIATGVQTDQQIPHLVAGLVYQLAVTTLTLGSAASVSANVSVS